MGKHYNRHSNNSYYRSEFKSLRLSPQNPASNRSVLPQAQSTKSNKLKFVYGFWGWKNSIGPSQTHIYVLPRIRITDQSMQQISLYTLFTRPYIYCNDVESKPNPKPTLIDSVRQSAYFITAFNNHKVETTRYQEHQIEHHSPRALASHTENADPITTRHDLPISNSTPALPYRNEATHKTVRRRCVVGGNVRLRLCVCV